MHLAKSELAPGVVLWGLLLLAGAALWQGLGGNFMFDDSWNLRGLEGIARQPGLEAASQYVLNGISSSLGRPLALATFALQFASWPDHPEDFIRFNICLHLLNACLLFWGLLRLFRLLPRRPASAEALALAATAVWVLAPLHASAVLYIVQRMAVLSATCMFMGLILYWKGRALVLDGRTVSGSVLQACGLAVGAGLGVLAKEVAALLPLLILVAEFTLARDLRRDRAWWIGAVTLLVIPATFVVAYLLWQLPHWQAQAADRDFTIAQRLLSEPRVLFLYLQKLLVPSLYSIRLLYDDLEVSRSLWQPWTTLPALLGWIVLAAGAVVLRRRLVVFAFAVLWYLASHLLESSIIPLELAFEHRNYVAVVGPIVALVWLGAYLLQHEPSQRLRPLLVFCGGLYLGFQALALWQSSALWSRPMELVLYWSHAQPNSKRVHYQQADMMLIYGFPTDAVTVYQRAMARWPGDPALPIALMEIGCHYPDLPPPDVTRVESALRQFDAQVHATLNMLDRILKYAEEGRCKRFSAEDLQRIGSWLIDAPRFASQKQNVLLIQSRAAELSGDHHAARGYLDQALGLQLKIPLVIQAVVWAALDGDIAGARAYLARLDTDPSVRDSERWAYRTTIEELRALVDHQERAGAAPG